MIRIHTIILALILALLAWQEAERNRLLAQDILKRIYEFDDTEMTWVDAHWRNGYRVKGHWRRFPRKK